jgi:ABC-type hemin transport system ATPase subunit
MVLLARGRVAAEGPPDAVLASEECARAFDVAIRGHTVPGSPHPLYSFEEPS